MARQLRIRAQEDLERNEIPEREEPEPELVDIVTDFIEKISDDEYSVHTVKGDTKHLNKEQFDKLLETKCINTDNKTLFLKHEVREGIVPTFCKKMYADRKKFQNKMILILSFLNLKLTCPKEFSEGVIPV